ncbi:MAG: hypothetical protein QM756_07700 [Polyangiaceae bacterium]
MLRILSFGGEDAARALIRSTHALRTAQSTLAWELLGKLDNEAARGFMLVELGGPNAVRACTYFKDFADVRAIEPLERAAREHGPAVADAVVALVAQGAPAQPSLARLLTNEDAAAAVIGNAASVLALRPALRASCIARLSNGGSEHGCLEYLQHDTSAAARNALLALANDENLARGATEALAARGDSDSNAALRSLQQGDRPWAACEARHALVQSADSRSRSALSALVDDGATGAALRSLLELAAPEGARALLALARRRKPHAPFSVCGPDCRLRSARQGAPAARPRRRPRLRGWRVRTQCVAVARRGGSLNCY